MQVTLVPKPTPPIMEQTISIDGQELGIVKTITNSDNYKYHAIINSRCGGGNIYQGFGMTIDEAMKDAFKRNRELRKKELAELDHLENVIWGDHELN
jgi:hypothetical protein